MNEYISMEGIEGMEGVTIEGDSIEIEGFDQEHEVNEHIRFIEAGMYDMTDEGIEGWGWFKKAFKAVTKPFVKMIKPAVKLATSVPGLNAIIPGAGTIKMGIDLFKDLTKVEKHTGKKIKFRPKAVQNVASMMYLKGYKEGRADEVKEQLKRERNGKRYGGFWSSLRKRYKIVKPFPYRYRYRNRYRNRYRARR